MSPEVGKGGRARKGLVALSALVVLGGCGIGAEPTAHAVDPHLAPPGLLAPSSSTTRPSSDVSVHTVTLFLASTDGLVAVDRATPTPVTLRDVLGLLGQGPSVAERSRGLESPVATIGALTLRSARAGTASVELPGAFTTLGGSDQIVAAAQLVYTVTGFPGIRRVAVWVGGRRAAMPSADGSLLSRPLTRADYQSLGPL